MDVPIPEPNDALPPEEIERRFQATLRRMLTTPKPKKIVKVQAGHAVATSSEKKAVRPQR